MKECKFFRVWTEGVFNQLGELSQNLSAHPYKSNNDPWLNCILREIRNVGVQSFRMKAGER